MSYTHLTMDERNVIFRMRVQKYSQAEIGRCLGRPRSTIWREMRRNAGCEGCYFPGTAQAQANARRRSHIRRPKTGDEKLMAWVEGKLRRKWSPEQISGRLREVGVAALPKQMGNKWGRLPLNGREARVKGMPRAARALRTGGAKNGKSPTAKPKMVSVPIFPKMVSVPIFPHFPRMAPVFPCI